MSVYEEREREIVIVMERGRGQLVKASVVLIFFFWPRSVVLIQCEMKKKDMRWFFLAIGYEVVFLV